MATNNGVFKGKHPTRLQKQAPATLQLDVDDRIPNNLSKTVIPFLSPLVLSPAPLPEVSDDEKRSFATPNTNNSHAIGIIPQVQQSSGGGASGWQHPAMAGPMADASSLYSYFHSQCTILPRNQ
ncbi:uncharacterized protein LOC112517767 [Cynara cardunculus var. scolymus]|uniref:uncharacterized protein LOC112517767 n=1 Tax=Cynara cardunculus var. scolymus TaxID=59895 RepID=UPI000D62D906|nr:uncharacterized protein LOC112517767 [Cynara cardunculus var. scolymus]